MKLSDGNVDKVKRGEAHGKNGSGIRVHREGRGSSINLMEHHLSEERWEEL